MICESEKEYIRRLKFNLKRKDERLKYLIDNPTTWDYVLLEGMPVEYGFSIINKENNEIFNLIYSIDNISQILKSKGVEPTII